MDSIKCKKCKGVGKHRDGSTCKTCNGSGAVVTEPDGKGGLTVKPGVRS